MTYSIRPAAARDASEIALVHARASRVAYAQVAAKAADAAPLKLAERESFWRDAIAFGEPLLFVALQDNHLIGFAGFDRSRDEGSPPSTGELWAFFVDPDHWGRGAGLSLWEAARDGLVEEDFAEVTWWVPIRNERALRFGEAAGFAREDDRRRTVTFGGVALEEVRLRRALP
jgi:GNAT superfamily N-acetyltransferase